MSQHSLNVSGLTNGFDFNWLLLKLTDNFAVRDFSGVDEKMARRRFAGFSYIPICTSSTMVSHIIRVCRQTHSNAVASVTTHNATGRAWNNTPGSNVFCVHGSMITVFDLISEHTLISGYPPHFMLVEIIARARRDLCVLAVLLCCIMQSIFDAN